MDTTNILKSVVDQNGVRYELTELLGRGGQGAVYAVKGGRLAVKIIEAGRQANRDRLRNQLTLVRRLPLQELSLAKPLELLRPPYTGYVMELLTGMTPIKTILMPSKGQTPSLQWYLECGSLQRRLFILARTANILAQLHGKGLVYSDPSPANIFISANQNRHEVWLIDTDNLNYESIPQGVRASVYTPGYGAPELVTGKSGVTTFTDSFAFAVIAFQCLTLTHPFIGDEVNNGDPDLEEQAFAGKLPWVDDPTDNRNRTSFGVPRAWVLSPRLQEVFGRVFGLGRTEPMIRPSMTEWMDRLFTAADATITCSTCAGSYYFTQGLCPWCKAFRPNVAVAAFQLWSPESKPGGGVLTKSKGGKDLPVVVAQKGLASGQTIIITRRLAFGHYPGLLDEPVVSATLIGDRITLRSLDGHVYRLISSTGNHQTEIDHQEKSIRISQGQEEWQLHFGAQNTLHRIVTFRLHGGVKQ